MSADSLQVLWYICSLVFHKYRGNGTFHRGFYHFSKEFHLFSARSSWYLKIISWNFFCNVDRRIGSYAKSLCGSWIAAMSVLLPFSKDMKYRVPEERGAIFNILGCMIFLILHAILPDHIFQWIGLIGRDRSWLFCWICLANRFQHLWGLFILPENLFGLKNAIILKNRCQCLWLSLCLWI